MSRVNPQQQQNQPPISIPLGVRPHGGWSKSTHTRKTCPEKKQHQENPLLCAVCKLPAKISGPTKLICARSFFLAVWADLCVISALPLLTDPRGMGGSSFKINPASHFSKRAMSSPPPNGHHAPVHHHSCLHDPRNPEAPIRAGGWTLGVSRQRCSR